jgi:hypothetical protein
MIDSSSREMFFQSGRYRPLFHALSGVAERVEDDSEQEWRGRLHHGTQ